MSPFVSDLRPKNQAVAPRSILRIPDKQQAKNRAAATALARRSESDIAAIESAQQKTESVRIEQARQIFAASLPYSEILALAATAGAPPAAGESATAHRARERRAHLAIQALGFIADHRLERLITQGAARVRLRPGFASRPWHIVWPLALPDRTSLGGVALESPGDAEPVFAGLKNGGVYGAAGTAKGAARRIVICRDTATAGAIDTIHGGAATIVIAPAGHISRSRVIEWAHRYGKITMAVSSNFAADETLRRIIDAIGAARVDLARAPITHGSWAAVVREAGMEAAKLLFDSARQPPAAEAPAPGAVVQLKFWTGEPREPEKLGNADFERRLLAGGIGKLLTAVDHGQHKKPFLVTALTGLGKTSTMLAAMAARRAPILFLTPRRSGAAEAYAALIAAGGKSVHLHVPRSPDSCFVYKTKIAPLTEPRRAPYAWGCLTCEHGKRDAPTRCGYMLGLDAARIARIVVATQDAAADDSSLMKFFGDSGGGDDPADRQLVIDESVPHDRFVTVKFDEIASARQMIPLAHADLPRREAAEIAAARSEAEKKRIQAAYRRADRWLTAIEPELAALSAHLGNAAPDQMIRLEIEKNEARRDWTKFGRLAAHAPSRAIHHDGTIVEDVDLATKNRMGVPSAWIIGLGKAILNETAWIHAGRIEGGYPAALWNRALRDHAILLDATPNLRARHEIGAAGGTIAPYYVPHPIEITQHGPHLYGRTGLDAEDQLGRRVRHLIGLMDAAIARGERPCAITHKPVALAAHAERPDLAEWVGWWKNDERQHNRWEQRNHLIIHGIHIDRPEILVRRYALAARACGWPAWDGTTEHQAEIQIDRGVTVISALPLPTVPEARAWLLDQIACDVAQAIGRLRAVNHDGGVSVDIFGAVPITGQNITITRFAMEAGRMATRSTRVAPVAAIIASLPESIEITRKMISDRLVAMGFRPSHSLISRVIAQARLDARATGIGLQDAAGQLAAQAVSLIRQHGQTAARAIASEALADDGGGADAARWRVIAALIRRYAAGEAHGDRGARPMAVTTPA